MNIFQICPSSRVEGRSCGLPANNKEFHQLWMSSHVYRKLVNHDKQASKLSKENNVIPSDPLWQSVR